MVNIAICEDEKTYSDKLISLLNQYSEKNGLAFDYQVYTDGSPFIDEIVSGKRFGICFFDIKLEKSDGIDTASFIRKYDSSAAFIFVTSIEDRAVEGYSVSAFDYIIKSSLEERLFAVLDRLFSMRRAAMLSLASDDGAVSLVPSSDVIYIESDGRGTMVTLRNDTIHSPAPVGKIASSLPGNRFIEIHKSVYVQVSKIKRIEATTVQMINGAVLPLSRRKRKQVMAAVMDGIKDNMV
ncbi:MAG: LytTR family DNA-binding domain-containing protein [Oscillospiraceae bacterium]|nr:LytTR family DNA-binding domain-containing protein [Oscillospiraceae bacterium]